ncbi:jg14059 [Pararge aegeria aegeria]|uniref:Jg14059 protein n=1 Tax=Pararge aegeria aegeria TaxID=348720 RepID=A0A8S4SNF9_9NEOP|nr:jg14059 [Pararge aegeria aegeria]
MGYPYPDLIILNEEVVGLLRNPKIPTQSLLVDASGWQSSFQVNLTSELTQCTTVRFAVTSQSRRAPRLKDPFTGTSEP